ncbi:helix-turn-helix domain-containing protein [Actinomadura adrarensis]|uniref:Helix-turn-helix domain-containing protein n=1 Tax=Actinomadura adrarensis TaxID=1819600 RepID=A0ABW3CHH8_9ACTN
MSRVTSRTDVSRRVGLRVRALRQARSWTQPELAARLSKVGFEISAPSITRMEQGSRQTVSIDAALALCDVFEVTLDDLISASCSRCHGAPPVGFRCQSCGAETTEPAPVPVSGEEARELMAGL